MTLTLFSSPSQPYISTPPNPCPLLPDLSLSYCSPALLEQSKRWTDEGKTYPETYWKWALRQPDISSLRFFIISVVWCYWHIKESLVILDFCHMLHFCLFTLNSLYYETMLHEHHHNVEFIFSHSIQGCLGKVYVQLCLVSILVDCFFSTSWFVIDFQYSFFSFLFCCYPFHISFLFLYGPFEFLILQVHIKL